MILLDSIHFDHASELDVPGALTIKWDATREVIQPEWRRGACLGPEDSPVAYSISENTGHAITIKARFRKIVPGLDNVEIRARESTLPNCDWPATMLSSVKFDRVPPSNPLGEVLSRCVTFGPDGLSGFETFELADTRLEEAGVGVWTTSWQWQYRQTGGHWVDFDRSEHRIFLLLESPKEPWTQLLPPPLGLSLPRVDALEFACRWAQRARTRTEVAASVTRGIYRAGPDQLRYDRPNGGGIHYVGNLTLLLDRLRGGEGNGAYLNCQDCADIVTTMANLLGCELWSCPIVDDDWETNPLSTIAINPIIVIGDTDWGFPFPELGEVFKMHQVALDGEATANDRVFDACLIVDGDDEPTKVSPDRVPLIPAGLPYVQANGLAYRERFAAPAGRGCFPDSFWRTRWPITERNVTHPEPPQSPVFRQIARLSEWSGTRTAGADVLFFPFDMIGDEIPGWRVLRVDRAFEGGGVPHVHLLLSPEDNAKDTRLRVDTWQLPSRTQAHEYLAGLLGHLEGGPLPLLDPAPVGDVAFAKSDGYFLAFARGNLVVWLRNGGVRVVSVADASQRLDRWLIQRPELPSESSVGASEDKFEHQEPIGYKYFADRGELSIKDGKPILRKASPGESSVVRVSLGPSSMQAVVTIDVDSE